MTLLSFIKLFEKLNSYLEKILINNKIKIKNVRFEMNPRNTRWGQRPLSYIQKIIVHQELGWGTAEQVHKYHISEKSHLKLGTGAPSIAYHYVIEVDGEILHVNDDTAITWHCAGQNLHSVGIMLVGDFPGPGHEGTGKPSIEQKESLKKLLNHLTSELKLKNTDVYSHNQFGKPACPGYTITRFITEYNWNGKTRI